MDQVIIEQMPDKEVVAEIGNHFICDVESYQNYFCICFESVSTGKKVYFEGTNFNRKKLRWMMNNCTIITFNGLSYDIHMMTIALLKPEYDEYDLFRVTQELIVDNVKPYKLYQNHNVNKREAGKVDHIDLINVAFGKASLKLYAGRLNAPHMQDLPYEPETELTPQMQREVHTYCFNDITNTGVLHGTLTSQLALRVNMSDEYGVDLRSKSDAQIAEAVISSEIRKRTGVQLQRPKIEPGTTFKYKVPDFISFQTDQFKNMLEEVRKINFMVLDGGGVDVPYYFKKLALRLGESIYKMGIGGIHSSESCRSHISDDEIDYIDKDVASYYPSIILNMGLYPEHMGPVFLDIYRDIVERRLHAKRTGDKTTNASLKITINGSFGKLGSKWSVLYAPDLLIQVTVTGQLALLMLIERLELAGFSVVSANTDGFITGVPKSRHDEYQAICAQWEKETDFELEDTFIKALYSRDVNNYIAITDGYAKTKGCYRPSDISKNPAGDIIYEAVVNNLKDDTPVEETIHNCTNIEKFVFVQTVKGGAVKDGTYIGKVVRWYQRKGDYTALRYKGSGNKVPKSDGGTPIMEMTGELPNDIDYSFYIRAAKNCLRNDFKKAEQLDMFGF